MKRKAVSGIMLTLLLISMLTLASNILPVKASGTIYIKADGSIVGTDKIQRDGDIYTFTDNIYDSILVERDNIVIDGAGYKLQGAGSGTGVFLFGRSNVTVNNIKITKFTSGIWLISSKNNIISGNSVSNSGYGIYLDSSSNNTLVGNKVSDNIYDFVVLGYRFSDFNNRVDKSNTVNGKPIYYMIGVANTIYDAQTNGGNFYLINSNNVTIRDLTVTQNGQGVFFWNTTNSKIKNVTASKNHFGIVLAHSCNNTLIGNNALNNGAGILLDRSSNYNVLASNNVANNLYGIWLEYSSNNNVLTGNNASNNQAGIYLEDSSNIILTSNNAFNNYMGTRLYNSSNNVLSGNNASNNYYGIWLYSSSNNNIVFHNNFIDNSVQAYSSESMNIWDDSYPSGGNYWSDYTGVDEKSGPDQDQPGSDGIGDTPYDIAENNVDGYPLVNPWVERKVGVKVGDWAKYGNFVFTWSSNDPKQYPPSDLTEWMNVTVQNIVGTNITFQLTIHYQTSAEETIIGWIDVSTSEAVGWWMPLFISADLSAGDTIYQTMFWAPINEIIFREYVGVTRETNHFSFEWSFDYYDINRYSNGSYSAYWDRATGILTEFMIENVHVDETLNYVTSTSISFEIVDTNTWKALIPTTIEDLKTEIKELGSEGEIDNQGIVKSLIAKLNVAQRLVDKGKVDEAKTILADDFVPQVQNLSGIHITPEAADILIQSAEYILSNL